MLGGPEETVKALAGEPPAGLCGAANRWCVPPCCCAVALAPCAFRDGAAPFEARLLAKLRRLVRQYCFVAPPAATAALVAHLAGLSRAAWAAEALQAVSMLACLQALFVLYKATAQPLAPFRTTAKFLGIKAMLVLSLAQRLLLRAAVAGGVLGPPVGGPYSAEAAATRAQALLLGWELPALQLLVNSAYPLAELLLAPLERYPSLSA